MKKFIYLASLIFGVTSLFSCAADEDGSSTSTDPVVGTVSAVTAEFANNGKLCFGQLTDGTSLAVTPRPSKNVKQLRRAQAVTEFVWYGKTATPLQPGTASKLTNEVFMKDFPNNQDNLKTAHPNLSDLSFDFLYVSNGEPVEVWPLYSHALYIDDIGIFYYDEQGNKYEKTFWSMADDGWLLDGWTNVKGGTAWKPTYQRTANKDVDTYNTEGYGFKFQLPKGWKWGFYINNDQNGQKYSKSTLHAKDSKGNLQKQVVTYKYGDYNIIGFEDIFYANSDKDYNDIALLVSPEQVVSPTGEVLVRWITEDGTELAPNETSGKLAAGATYTGVAKKFPGYELVDPSHTQETKVVNEYYNDNVITFVYRRKATEYTINHICQDQNTLLEKESGTALVGETIYAQQKQFADHGFVLADKESVVLDEDATKNVINLYYKHAETSYVVKYLEEGTNNELATPTTVNNKTVGGEVKADPIAIEGYDCTNPATQTHILKKDPNENVYIFYYKKQTTVVPIVPIEPATEPDILIVLNALDLDLICESDDFCIKYNKDEMEYGYADHSASNLVNLKLEQGKPISITIPDINAWANGEKVYWQDLENGTERACLDLRIYNCRDAAGNIIPAEKLAGLFYTNLVKKPEGYSVELNFEAAEDQYGNAGVHISILVDRIKQ